MTGSAQLAGAPPRRRKTRFNLSNSGEACHRIPAAGHARGDASFRLPLEIRRRREDRVRAAPASLACKKTALTHASYTGTTGASGLPCAMVLTAAPRSPRGTGLDSPRHLRAWLADLIPASGDQDHTAWPSAKDVFVDARQA